MTKRLTRLMSLVLVLVMLAATLTACPDKKVGVGVHTYQTYTALSPSNWNELTYQDNNDTQIMGYIGSSFFSFDFKFDENGEILPGEFTVNYSAATKLEDVTAEYAEAWDLDPDSTGYAYKITLRDDLKWENGDPIKAEDFVYSMQEQLNPLFQNYRADSYYNSAQSLIGAKAYAKQGQSGLFAADQVYSIEEYSEELDNVLVWKLGPAKKDDPNTPADETEGISYIRSYFESASVGMPTDYSIEKTAAFCAGNFGATAEAWIACEGKTLAEIKADPALNACLTALMGWWQTEPGEEIHACLATYTFPEASWDDVGMFAVSDYEFVIVLVKALDLLNEDGSLSYKAAYNLSSLPLVHKATYEACKIEPTGEARLWTSNYNSSKETTMSWGPYKLESFQSGKQYVVVRNDNWYGYGMPENEGLYQTDRVLCETISEWNTAWLKFLAGEIDGIGIDVSVADDYKGSSRAYFTPDDYIDSLQLQSDKAALQERESDGVNKTILTYADFRKALSLSVDRAGFNTSCTTSSLPGFGIYNSMHYNDVANGGVYRNTDEAKRVLCEIYAVNPDNYASLDDAVDAITGYNLDEARALVDAAYDAALAAGDIKETDKVVLTYGTSVTNASVERSYNYLTNGWTEMFKGTKLEGRVEFELKEFGSKWANDFRAGAYDICKGGWTGAAWDPGYFLLAYLHKDYMYSQAWATDSQMMTFTMKGVAADGGDIEETMTLLEWYDCLNGNTGCKYDWSSNALEESQRVQLIAALEAEVLKVYYTVPISNSFGASMLSYKVDYITYEYNTFMSYGGMKYMTYHYDDYEWTQYVKSQGGQLNYKQ